MCEFMEEHEHPALIEHETVQNLARQSDLGRECRAGPDSRDSQGTADNSREHVLKDPESGTPPNLPSVLECREILVSPELGPEAQPMTPSTGAKSPPEAPSPEAAPEPGHEVLGLDTFNFLIVKEQEYWPDPYYIEKMQPDLQTTMRLILMDWMMDVCNEFGLKRETFHCATNYVDRYLSSTPNVRKTELQLVGVTALYLSAKMEEVYSPKIQDFARATDNAYKVEQIRKMERVMGTVRETDDTVDVAVAFSAPHTEHVGQLVHEPMGHVHPEL